MKGALFFMQKKQVISVLLAGATVCSGIPVQAVGVDHNTTVTTPVEFQSFVSSVKQDLDLYLSETEGKLQQETSQTALALAYSNASNAISSTESQGNSLPTDENYALNIQSYVDEIESIYQTFVSNANDIVAKEMSDLETLRSNVLDSLSTLEALSLTSEYGQNWKAQVIEREKPIITATMDFETLTSSQSTINFYVQVLPIKDLYLTAIEGLKDPNLYSTENQMALASLVNSYCDQIIGLTGDVGSIASGCLQLQEEFETKANEIPTLAEELESAKTNAVEQIREWLDRESEYSQSNFQTIQSIVSETETKIQDASSLETVKGILSSAEQELNEIPTIAEEEAAFEEYQKTKKEELNQYKDPSLYFAEEQSTLTSILSQANSQINQATTREDVDQIVSDTKVDLDQVQTREDFIEETKEKVELSTEIRFAETKETLDQLYSDTIQALDTVEEKSELQSILTQFQEEQTSILEEEDRFLTEAKETVNQTDLSVFTIYTEEVQTLKAQTLEDMDSATSKEDVSRFLSNFQSEISRYELMEENYKELEEKREQCKTELDLLETSCENFLPQFLSQAEDVLSNAREELDRCATITAMDTLIQNVNEQIESLKKANDAEMERLEQLETAKETALDQIQEWKLLASDMLETFQIQAMNLLNDAESRIMSATTEENITSILSSTETSFQTLIEKDLEEKDRLQKLAEAKQSAISTLDSLDLSSLEGTFLEEANTIIASAKTQIQSATTVDQVSSILNEATEQIEIIIRENQEAEEFEKLLEETRKNALETLNQIPVENLNETHQELLNNRIETAKTEIASATSVIGIQEIVAQVQAMYQEFFNQEAELNQSKSNAKDQLNSISTEGMLEENKKKIESLISSAISQIDQAPDTSTVQNILTSALQEINTVKENDQKEQEEIEYQKQLEEAKNNAFEQLSQVSTDGLLDKNKQSILELITSAKETIHQATEVSKVTEILSQTLLSIQTIKEEDQKEQEIIAEVNKKREQYIQSITETEVPELLESYRVQLSALKTDMIEELKGATEVSQLDHIYETFLSELEALKDASKQEEEYQNALETAKQNAIETLLQTIQTQPYFTQEEIQTISLLQSNTVEKLQHVTTIAEVEQLRDFALETYETICSTSFQNYRILQANSLDQLYKDTILHSDTVGESKMEEYRNKILSAENVQEISDIFLSFQSWISDYSTEICGVVNATYTGHISPINTKIDVSQISFQFEDRTGFCFDAEESDQVVCNQVVFAEDGTASIACTIRDFSFIITISNSQILPMFQADIVEAFTEKYETEIQRELDEIRNWKEAILTKIEETTDYVELSNLYKDAMDQISTYASMEYHRVYHCDTKVDLMTKTIDPSSVTAMIQRVNGTDEPLEIVSVSPIVWKGNEPSITVLFADETQVELALELNFTVDIDACIDMVKELLVKESTLTYSDLQEEWESYVSQKATEAETIETIEDFHSIYQQLLNEITNTYDNLKAIDTARTTGIAVLENCKQNDLNNEHQEALLLLIEQNQSMIMKSVDVEEIRTLVNEVQEKLTQYEQEEQAELEFEQLQTEMIQKVQELPTEIYENPENAKELIDDAILGLHTATSVDELQRIYQVLEQSLKELPLKADLPETKPVDPVTDTSNETVQETEKEKEEVEEKTTEKIDGKAEPVQTGDLSSIYLLSIFSGLGVAGIYKTKRKK